MKKIFIVSIFLLFSLPVYSDQKTIDLVEIKLKEIGNLDMPKSYPNGLMETTFKNCKIDNFICLKNKATEEMSLRFKRTQKYNDRNPGSQIYAMALYEIYYLSKLKDAQKDLKKFREKWPKKIVKGRDISSLIKANETRKIMREPLGMSIAESPEYAIKYYWIIGDFLQRGNPKVVKVDKELKKRDKLLSEYKSTVGFLKKRIEKKEINKLYEFLEN